MTPSKASARVLGAYYKERQIAPPPITPIQFGHGFERPQVLSVPRQKAKPPYVLFVSTLEVCKNHVLLLGVWSRILEKYPPARVPDLVFVGKFGWEIAPLKAETARTNHLQGKLEILRNLSDPELDHAYQKCQFNVFPSFCEGGGDYFDPSDGDAAFELIERAIFDETYRQSKESQIEAAYTLPVWDATVDHVLAAFQALDRSVLQAHEGRK